MTGAPKTGTTPTRRCGIAGLVAILLLMDVLAVAASFLLAFLLRRWAPALLGFLSPLKHGLDLYLRAWPALLLWPLMFWREGLYPGFWLTAREELRRSVAGATLAALFALAATFVTQTGPQYSRPIVVGGWMLSLVFVPSARWAGRHLLRRLGLAGPSAVLLGGGSAGRLLLEGLAHQRLPALQVAAIFDDERSRIGRALQGVEVTGRLEEAGLWAKERRISTAVVALPGMAREDLVRLIRDLSKTFTRIILIPDLLGLSSAEVSTHEISGMLALELRNNLLFRRNLAVKRIIDLVLLLMGAVIALPLGAAIGAAIWIESGRLIFFTHERIGQGGGGSGPGSPEPWSTTPRISWPRLWRAILGCAPNGSPRRTCAPIRD